jgi:hypothetical protein
MRRNVFRSTRWRIAAIFLLSTLASCSGFAGKPNGLPDNDDELMIAIATLAKKGPKAICNRAEVEETLGIVISDIVTKNEDLNTPNAIRDETSTSIRSKRRSTLFSSAGYVRFSSKTTSRCYLSIKLDEGRLCDRTSPKAMQIMGSGYLSSSVTQHMPPNSASVIYKFGSEEDTVVALGSIGQKCGNWFSINAKGIWK